MATAKTLGFVLFDQFELLDVFGPAEAFGLRDLDGAFRLVMVAAAKWTIPYCCDGSGSARRRRSL